SHGVPKEGSPGTCCEREGRPVHRCAALCLDVPGSLLRLYHSCPYYQASIQAAALPGTDGCLASPRVPAGLEAACAGGSGAAVEVVRPGSSMSGRQRRQQQQQQQQQQPASGCQERFRWVKSLNVARQKHTQVVCDDRFLLVSLGARVVFSVMPSPCHSQCIGIC
ncbi:hypothetical protein O3P69_011677, partial [Scylla paramamosain]